MLIIDATSSSPFATFEHEVAHILCLLPHHLHRLFVLSSSYRGVRPSQHVPTSAVDIALSLTSSSRRNALFSSAQACQWHAYPRRDPTLCVPHTKIAVHKHVGCSVMALMLVGKDEQRLARFQSRPRFEQRALAEYVSQTPRPTGVIRSSG